MGQARRRKLAGDYPAQDDFAAIRRFWCGREPVPADEFVAPAGTLAITFDVTGAPPTTWLFDVARIVELEAEAQAALKASGMRAYRDFVAGLAAVYVKERPHRVEKTMSGIGLGGLWTALNHPELGAEMRAKVSQSLRTTGTAHITWRFDKQHGFALVLADHFVDMASVTAVAPRDCVIAYVSTSTDT